jgi:hypothetical protein
MKKTITNVFFIGPAFARNSRASRIASQGCDNDTGLEKGKHACF